MLIHWGQKREGPFVFLLGSSYLKVLNCLDRWMLSSLSVYFVGFCLPDNRDVADHNNDNSIKTKASIFCCHQFFDIAKDDGVVDGNTGISGNMADNAR